MKTMTLIEVLWICALLLTACGGVGIPRTLTPESRLALGTLKLEGTPRAVDSALASRLLPLWQLLAQLNASTSTAPQEVTAVVEEIQATMTADQLNAINSMQLSGADVFSVLQQQGMPNSSGGPTDSASSHPSGSPRHEGSGSQDFVVMGVAPAVGAPGGSLGHNGGAGFRADEEQNSPSQSTQPSANALSSLLVNQVVQLLESKIKS